MRSSFQRGNRGTTLLEVLVYVSVVVVCINLAAGSFMSVVRLNTVGGKTLDRALAFDALAGDFSRVMREAARVAPGIGPYRSGEQQLVLERPTLEEGKPSYTVLTVHEPAGPDEPVKLSKVTLAEQEGELEILRAGMYSVEAHRIGFAYDASAPERARLVTMEVQGRRMVGSGGLPLRRISGALGALTSGCPLEERPLAEGAEVGNE